MMEKIIQYLTIIGQSWTTWTIAILILLVISLLWQLIKRERTWQLKQFTLSVLGQQFLFEIDKDKKLEALVLENIRLHNEVKMLKSSVRKERWHSFTLIMILFILRLLDKVKLKPSVAVEDVKLLDAPKNQEKSENL